MIHRAFEVYVSCNGRKLDEFQTKLEDPNTITCYIPSEANKVIRMASPGATYVGSHIIHLQSFSVSYRSFFDDASASVRCMIDGRKMGASVCRAGRSGNRWGVRVAPELRQPYQFSELSLTGASSVTMRQIYALIKERC